MKAYVLMQADPTKVEEIADKMRGTEAGGGRCVSVDIVMGPYDSLCLRRSGS